MFLIASAFAQEYRATLSGRITDPQGAVVPGVKIIAVNQPRRLQMALRLVF